MMFKLSLKKQEFKIGLQKHVFKAKTDMHKKLTVVIADFKIVGVLKSVVRVSVNIIAQATELLKTSGSMKNKINIKASMFTLIRSKLILNIRSFNVDAITHVLNKSNSNIDTKIGIGTSNKIITKTSKNIYGNIKVKAHAWLVRLRKLEEIDGFTLGELDSMTLEEIDYIKL